MDVPPKTQLRDKLNKTFARRIGKRLSFYNKDILENILPKYHYSNESLLASQKQKKYLEIGFGMGEHLLNEASLHRDNLYIGVEAYLNGVANFLKLATREAYDNFLIWPNDLDMMLGEMPDNSIDGVYILFPDPWHKRKYLKKRLVNRERLDTLKLKLKTGGFVVFASDIEDYSTDVMKLFEEDKHLELENAGFSNAHKGYLRTKYHLKALREGREVRFLSAVLRPTIGSAPAGGACP